ncbi:hypothetical protein LOD99_7096 [Oopsacas minuta]|uniref:Uncharacterized protein n=1 Tax=Oopsacas minuta TaxID=111878 RepID=A0AAV7JKB6_9METZ|nr:hypothetical protein LOD99_7096 [Oopsacas minuta]
MAHGRTFKGELNSCICYEAGKNILHTFYCAFKIVCPNLVNIACETPCLCSSTPIEGEYHKKELTVKSFLKLTNLTQISKILQALEKNDLVRQTNALPREILWNGGR